MADEPERRIVGAIHAELEKQQTDGNLETLGYLNTDGLITVQGELDLYLLARAVLTEVKDQQDAEAAAAEAARKGVPQTREQVAAFAKRWDERYMTLEEAKKHPDFPNHLRNTQEVAGNEPRI